MNHTVLTFIAPVDRDRLAALEALLAQMEPDPGKNKVVPFASIDGLHFASLVILPATEGYEPYLVFENNFDGPLDSYLDALLGKAAPGLHQIFNHCADYPQAQSPMPIGLRAYLMRHVVRPNAYHVGTPGRSRERIHRETDLRRELHTFVDGLAAAPGTAPGLGQPPAALRQRIQGFVTLHAPWVAGTGPRLSRGELLMPRVVLGVTIVAAILLFWILIPVGLIWLALLSFQESRDLVQSTAPAHDDLQRLLDRESRTHIVQNHMANISHVKDGWLRRTTLWIVLWLANRWPGFRPTAS